MNGYPDLLQINAFSSVDNTGAPDPALKGRALQIDKVATGQKLPVPPADPRNWQDPRVGWGIVLPENEALSKADRSTAVDAPPAIQRLVAARGNAPVLRAKNSRPPGTIRRYYADGSSGDLSTAGSQDGTAKDCIPRYLLIAGSPEAISWEIQYELQQRRFVGRLDLDDAGFEHYVEALLTDWAGMLPKPKNSLVWSVDSGGEDITALMARTVGLTIHQAFAGDADPDLSAGARMLTGLDAVGDRLLDAIATDQPSLIVTTSHGQTGPVTNLAAMRAALGLLVDDNLTSLDPTHLTGNANPSGAIWFAQACCSAGSAAHSAYNGILTPGSDAQVILDGVASCGSTTAPLPRALLGAERPLKAFVGHVEPTFNWSLQHPKTKQALTKDLVDCFHRNLFLGEPVSMALQSIRDGGAGFLTIMDLAEQLLGETGEDKHLGTILAAKLVARDWRSVVLLGDPTVTKA